MRILIAIPHFFAGVDANATNRSRLASAKNERLRALTATICGIHQTLGTGAYGLDHALAKVWPRIHAEPHAIDIVVCTTGTSHLMEEIESLNPLFTHHNTSAEPLMLGFECHKVLRDARGRYDYYAFVEDDIVLTDPLFFKKRQLFDRLFGPLALLQPNRYELSVGGAVNKLYVDYRLKPKVTAAYQDIHDQPQLRMNFLDETVTFERTTYPSAGCFFLSAEQLGRWVDGPYFLDGDVSYMSPLDSAVTLSVMKSFRTYKPILDQAWFLEVLHASPRWIQSVTQLASIASPAERPDNI